ncbi:hypothetical protein [Minwuia thermotolerans]|uniref:hypothetical protein n=1 Tax=Minwuia thermotolerans TaxID=2056226 RepID=UPI0013DE6732|nr:hypothetical protein [Minwuia thermotolerans]
MSAPRKARSQRVKKRAFHRCRHHGAPAEVPRALSVEALSFLRSYPFDHLSARRG